jgi:hypothetical protein
MMIHVAGTLRIAPRDSCSRGILRAVASAIVLVSSCTGSKPTMPSPTASTETGTPSVPSVQPVTDFASFATGLEAAGYTVRVKRRTGLEDIFRTSGRSVRVDGALVMAFEYPTETAAAKLQSSIDGPNAEYVGDAVIDWCCPHLYASERLIVVYLGDRPAVIRTLTELLGPQFAPA